MNEINLLLKLNEELETLEKILSIISDSKETLNNYLIMCDTIIQDYDYNYFSKLDLDKLFNEVGYNNSIELEKLKLYQKIINSSNSSLDVKQKGALLDVLHKIHEIISFKISNNQELEKDFKLRFVTLQNIVDKLKNNVLDKECYEFLCEYLLSDKDTNLESNLDFFATISLNYHNASNGEYRFVKEEVDNFELTNLELEKVKELFSKYGYDFLEISDEVIEKISPKIDNKEVSPRQYILKLGKYDNIEEILKVLSENNIKLNFNELSNQLCMILVFSNNYNISTIINNIKADIEQNANYSFEEIFSLYIKRPSFFIKGKKHIITSDSQIKEEHTIPQTRKKDSNVISGVFDNYINNRKKFNELDLDINSIMINAVSVFDASSKAIANNIEILDSYDISKEHYANTLTCLEYDSFKIASTIDRFIELGAFNLGVEGYNHIKNNLTRIIGDVKPLLYKLINAVNDGKRIDELFQINSKGKKYMSLRAKVLNSYPDDGIYINGIKVELKTLETRDSSVENIDFSNMDIPVNSNLFNNYFVNEIEKFKENDLYYNFNGVIISRNKVLRNINILLYNKKVTSNNVLYAITKDSILTQVQCDTILNCLYHIVVNDSLNYNGGYKR